MGWNINHANIHKLKLDDGRFIFMLWMGIQGPVFYEDEDVQVDILNWHNDPLIVLALKRFEKRDTGI